MSLLYDYKESEKDNYLIYFNQELNKYRKEFYNAPVESISQSVSIGAYKQYCLDDTNSLVLAKRCPPSVHAIARYNYLAHKNGEDNLKTYSGKIKYYNIAISTKQTGYFGFPAGELPSWAPKMDKLTQWTKNVIDPINRFMDALKLQHVNATGVTQLSLF